MIYLVDSAGARITDQVQMFPGRRGAGRIFHNEVVLSGRVPQVCLLFGPSAAGRRIHPRVLRRRDHARRQRVDVPRVAAHGRDGDRREGERSRRWAVRGCTRRSPVAATSSSAPTRRRSTSRSDTCPTCRRAGGRRRPRRRPPSPRPSTSLTEIVPADENSAFDVMDLIEALVDADSFLEVHSRWAKELVVGFARLEGRAIGVVANQPKVKGGVLFVDSADKAARFIWTCNAFNVPLLFLADVPGFMIGTQVERQGIIRHGAKMISAVSEATVPKLSVIVRKAYGAGLYAMAGPAFEPDACIALPTASIAVMGPEAAINAVFYNQIQAIEDPAEREEFVRRKRAEYAADIDILHLASELVVDADHRARRASRRADPAVRGGRREGPSLQRTAKSDHAGLGGLPERHGRQGARCAPDGSARHLGWRLRRRARRGRRGPDPPPRRSVRAATPDRPRRQHADAAGSRAATACSRSDRSAACDASSDVGTFLCPDDFIALHAGKSAFDDRRSHVVPGFDADWRERVVGAVVAPRRAPASRRRRLLGVDRPAIRDLGRDPPDRPPRGRDRHDDRLGVRDRRPSSACRYAAICIVDNLANGVAERRAHGRGVRGRPRAKPRTARPRRSPRSCRCWTPSELVSLAVVNATLDGERDGDAGRGRHDR